MFRLSSQVLLLIKGKGESNESENSRQWSICNWTAIFLHNIDLLSTTSSLQKSNCQNSSLLSDSGYSLPNPCIQVQGFSYIHEQFSLPRNQFWCKEELTVLLSLCNTNAETGHSIDQSRKCLSKSHRFLNDAMWWCVWSCTDSPLHTQIVEGTHHPTKKSQICVMQCQRQRLIQILRHTQSLNITSI